MQDRARLKQLFQYVRALHDIRHQPPQQISDDDLIVWLDQLPSHASIEITRPSFDNHVPEMVNDDSDPNAESDRFSLAVSRPTITDPPPPPGFIRSWLRPGWNEVDAEADIFDVLPVEDPDGLTIDIAFDDDPSRRQAFENWKRSRDDWAIRERPARHALALFQRLYSIYGTIERDAEQLELVIGDGILDWRTRVRQRGIQGSASSQIRYPLLLQRLELSFDPSVPKFEITETDQPTIWNGALLRLSEDIPESALARAKQEFDKLQSQLHPLDDAATSGFLNAIAHILSETGEFHPTEQPRRASTLQIFRGPVIFHRRRGGEMAAALDAVIEAIEERDTIAPALASIVGLSPDDTVQLAAESDEKRTSTETALEILFTKPSNKEQIQIAERLDRYGSVIVQGPPGTGKTHTIANLIGHLLAHGKRVLVTSHTSKALRVLREKVAEELQPLCVSVLDRDSESRAQLEDAVAEIVRRLSAGNVEAYDRQAEELARERARVSDQLHEVREKISQRAANEYRPIVVGGESIGPSEAARNVAMGKGISDWIPSPVTAGDALPLSVSVVEALYHTSGVVSADDEYELSNWLPTTDDLIAPDNFRQLVSDRERLKSADLSRFDAFWKRPSQGDELSQLSAAGQSLQRAKVDIDAASALQRTVITASLLGDVARGSWERLVSAIGAASEAGTRADEASSQFELRLPSEMPPPEQIGIIDAILGHIDDGKRLRLLFHPAWRRYVSAASVNDHEPSTKAEFEALRAVAKARQARQDLTQRWQHRASGAAAEIPSTYQSTPERYCHQYIQQINDGLKWHDDVWSPIRLNFDELGFDWTRAESAAPIIADDFIELKRIEATIDAIVLPAFDDRQLVIRAAKIDQSFAKLNAFLSDQRAGESKARIIGRIRAAITSRDVGGYEACWKDIDRINRLRPVLQSRQELLSQLNAAAPAWANAICDRVPPHDSPEPPSDVATAWQFRQYEDELIRREHASPAGLEAQSLELTQRLEQLTARLVETLAWSGQLRRTTPAQRQALVGWEQTVKKIGKGTGKKAPRLRREARQLMRDCRTAVPVWIMPLTQLAESFNPSETMFDVVIVDEASQCDVKMLLAMYMSKAAVVVGDDEQVTPDTVGSAADQELRLQTEYLRDVPNSHLYDGRLSIYDLALQSFGGVIALREHFRCVPEIIQFSNQLSYQGRILPLRESGTLQPLVSYRVDALPEPSYSADKLNHQEAETVIALVQAIIDHPRYEDKTIGVISLSGEPQAVYIDQRLREMLPPTDIEARRIIAGIPPNFQGDERDIVLLSLVSRPESDPLRKLRMLDFGYHDMYKKRYNVAVSRARDQLWVVHSVDTQTDLKLGDLRKRLLDYTLDPDQWRVDDSGDDKVESEFERRVLHRLQQAGYRVTPQWKVGYYRIDLVVEGGGKRLAIECDGDRYHPIDKVPDDMERQQILERLGWTFERIRGSAFFRDPDKAMGQVFSRLERLGIPPETGAHAKLSQMTYETEVRDAVIRRAEAILRAAQQTDRTTESEPDRTRHPRQTEPSIRRSKPAPVTPSFNRPKRSGTKPTAVPPTTAGRKESRVAATLPLPAASERLARSTNRETRSPLPEQRPHNDDISKSLSDAFVQVGSIVTVRSLGEETVYEIAESGDTHATPKKVSSTSPVGKALLGHRQGDRVKVQSSLMVYDIVIVRVESPSTAS